MSSQDEDQGSKAGLVVIVGVVAVALLVALGMAIRHSFKSAAGSVVAEVAADAASAAPAEGASGAVAGAADTAADTLVDLSPTGPALATVYFGSGQADVAADADAALAQAVQALAGAAGKKVLLSGYHDSTGDPARNAELAKERAKAVRAALVARGLSADQVLLRKPEVTTGGGSDQEARRVEIRVVDAP